MRPASASPNGGVGGRSSTANIGSKSGLVPPNTINQTTVQNINVGQTVGSTVNVIAPQTMGAEQEGVISAAVGGLLAMLPV